MKSFIFALSFIASLVYLSLEERKNEARFNDIQIDGAIRVQYDELNDSADFQRIVDTDLRVVDSGLAKYSLTRISPAFASKNGRYIITFAKESETTFKRVLFVDGRVYADDVKSVSKNRISTASGEIQSINRMTTGD